MDTCKLTTDGTWDFDLDAFGNVATTGDSTGDPEYRLAQDAATRVLSWQGEVYYDDTIGIPYPSILGGPPSLPFISSLYAQQAVLANGVKQCVPDFTYTPGAQRELTGQLLVADANGRLGTLQV